MLILVLQTLVQVTAFVMVAIIVLVLYRRLALRALSSRTRRMPSRQWHKSN
jgi:hypothetical protein